MGGASERCGFLSSGSSVFFLIHLIFADGNSKDPLTSSHIWLLCAALVLTLLEGQR